MNVYFVDVLDIDILGIVVLKINQVFKKGQRVVVLNAHVDKSNAFGIVIRPNNENGFKGQWWIDVGYCTISIEEDRLKDEQIYWKEYRHNRVSH